MNILNQKPASIPKQIMMTTQPLKSLRIFLNKSPLGVLLIATLAVSLFSLKVVVAEQNSTFELTEDPMKFEEPSIYKTLKDQFFKKNYAAVCESNDWPNKFDRYRFLAADFYNLKGWGCLLADNSVQAEINFKKSLDFRTTSSSSYYGLAKVNVKKELYPEARKLFEEALWFNNLDSKDSWDFKYDFANTLEHLRDMGAAEQTYRDLLKIEPDNQAIIFALGKNLNKSGKHSEALTTLAKLTNRTEASEIIVADSLLGTPSTIGLKDPAGDEALAIIMQLKATNYEPQQTLFLQIRALIRKELLEQAEQFAEQAISSFPDDARFQEQLKQIKINQKALENLEELLNQSATVAGAVSN